METEMKKFILLTILAFSFVDIFAMNPLPKRLMSTFGIDLNNINAINNEGETALVLAAKTGNEKILAYVYKNINKSLRNKPSNDGLMPIHYAVREHKPKSVKFLLGKFKTNANLPDNTEAKRTPIFYLINDPSKYPKSDVMLSALLIRVDSILKHFLKKKVNLDYKDKTGKTVVEYIQEKVTTIDNIIDKATKYAQQKSYIKEQNIQRNYLYAVKIKIETMQKKKKKR